MDKPVIVAHEKDRKALLDNLTTESMSRTLRLFVDTEKPEKELLADLVYEDFVRSR
jgi:hypothetical protein